MARRYRLRFTDWAWVRRHRALHHGTPTVHTSTSWGGSPVYVWLTCPCGAYRDRGARR